MTLARAALLGGLLLMVAFSGCLGGPPPAPPAPPAPPPELDQTQQARLQILAAPEVRQYTLPGSAKLEPQVAWFNGTIGAEANTAYQDRNMRGGNDFRTQLQAFDISTLVPPGQPTALRITLFYFGQLGSSASAHIYVCVPGTCSYLHNSNSDEFNWKATIETANVVTVGVPGEVHEVGVAVANGKIVNPMQFSLNVEATYFNDVVTPFYGYAFSVPQGATGVTLRSVKPGQEHLQAKFLILDPQDQLVSYTEYDDIAIVSESIFVPTRQPGEYVFYAQEMHNGFFSIASDAPLGEATAMRAIAPTVATAVDASGPAPGVPERDLSWTPCVPATVVCGPAVPVATPYSSGTQASFTPDGFPVEMGATIGSGGQVVTGAAEVRILSSQGLVYRLQRMLRADTDDGSVGYTRDEHNTFADWSKLAPGAYTVDIVSDANTGEIGHWVKTIKRA